MKKILFALAVFGTATGLNAETLSFPSFRIDIENGWVHSVESALRPQNNWGSLISINSPIGIGELKLQSYNAPDLVSQEILRNMTNVDSSKSIAWQNWGELSGYQYDYIESGLFYRQWWLTREKTIVFITYVCNVDSKDIEIDQINKIVDSISASRN